MRPIAGIENHFVFRHLPSNKCSLLSPPSQGVGSWPSTVVQSRWTSPTLSVKSSKEAGCCAWSPPAAQSPPIRDTAFCRCGTGQHGWDMQSQLHTFIQGSWASFAKQLFLALFLQISNYNDKAALQINAWGNFCKKGFNLGHAETACRQLDLDPRGVSWYSATPPSNGPWPVWDFSNRDCWVYSAFSNEYLTRGRYAELAKCYTTSYPDWIRSTDCPAGDNIYLQAQTCG